MQYISDRIAHPFGKPRPHHDARYEPIAKVIAEVYLSDTMVAQRMLDRYERLTKERGSVYNVLLGQANLNLKRGKARNELRQRITLAHHQCFNLTAVEDRRS